MIELPVVMSAHVAVIVEQGMEHFVVKEIRNDKSRNSRRVEHRTDRDGVMDRIIVSEPAPTPPYTPTQPAQLKLIVEELTVQIEKNLGQ